MNDIQTSSANVDEVHQDLNNSKYFSKLDLNSAYHQIEFDSESRDITTFATHKGLYRYKRLMFGVSCTLEMYQKILQQVLQEYEGAYNILDGMVRLRRNMIGDLRDLIMCYKRRD